MPSDVETRQTAFFSATFDRKAGRLVAKASSRCLPTTATPDASIADSRYNRSVLCGLPIGLQHDPISSTDIQRYLGRDSGRCFVDAHVEGHSVTRPPERAPDVVTVAADGKEVQVLGSSSRDGELLVVAVERRLPR